MNAHNNINIQIKDKANLNKIRNNSKKIYKNNTNINLIKNNKNNNKENRDNKDNIIPKQKYNIDLFLGVKEQFQNEQSESNNNKNIYLNFYNKHTKNQVLQKENKISKKFLDNNKEYIKEKQEKFKLKKAEEEKIRKQKEKEDTNEYRKLQMAKLYKMEDIYKKEIIKRKNKKVMLTKKDKIAIIAKNKNDIKINQNKKKEQNIKIDKDIKINDNNEIQDEKIKIKITRDEYNNKLDSLIKQTRIYLNELEKLPIANKNSKIYEREIQLNKYIDEIQEQIKKYQLLEGIEIIENS
jgi:hypothetical protein